VPEHARLDLSHGRHTKVSNVLLPGWRRARQGHIDDLVKVPTLARQGAPQRAETLPSATAKHKRNRSAGSW